MMLLRSQSISYFNVKRTIWFKGYQNGNHIEPSEQWLQGISNKHCEKNPARGQFFAMLISCSRCSFNARK